MNISIRYLQVALFVLIANQYLVSAFEQQKARQFPFRHPTRSRSSRVRLGDSRSSEQQPDGIRLNKVFKQTHSRRQADALIASGRVRVNGDVPSAGMRVDVHDVVTLDDEVVHWAEAVVERPVYDYIKYWKPLNVICTTDKRIRGNILEAMEQAPASEPLPQRRIFPVGRLDKDTTGLILLTSDGRLPNLVLRGDQKKSKTYLVQVNKPLTPDAIQALREGVVITTQAQRDRQRPPPLTARTRPCQARQLSTNVLEITICEGRNRQVRKMLEAVGYHVQRLHRSSFMDMTLEGLEKPGQWKRLSPSEQAQVDAVLHQSQSSDLQHKHDAPSDVTKVRGQ